MTKTGEAVSQKFEFDFSNKDFNRLCALVFQYTGITLGEEKKQLTYSRYAKRLRALGLKRFSEYIDRMESGDEEEIPSFVSAITTNFTSFFREPHHFDILETLAKDQLAATGKLRIWSSACSSGEEPYSIAIRLLDSIPGIENKDVKILASDLDTDILRRAESGVYTEDRIEGLDSALCKRWFKRGSGENKGHVKVHPKLQEMIHFKQLNLLKDWPFSAAFDIIFCRNVVIYFNKDVQATLFAKFAAHQNVGGHLVIGHSENLSGVSDKYKLIGKTVYERI